jgi:hypothetical protein
VNSISQIQTRRFYAILTILCLAGWGIVVADRFLFDGTWFEGKTLCLIKELTGCPCPSCGIRTGIGFITRFEVSRAVLHNPFSLLVAAGGLVVPVWIIRDFFYHDLSLFRFNRKTGIWLKKNPLAIVIFVIMILGNWIWNFYKF